MWRKNSTKNTMFIRLTTGRVTLNGQQALVYVRVRRSDIERVQRQQQFVHALYEQIKAKKPTLPWQISS